MPGTFDARVRFSLLKEYGGYVSVFFTLDLATEQKGEREKEKYALFEACALVHKDHVYTACLYLTKRREEAEDLFQETYLRAFRSFHRFTPGTNCRAWLLAIMHNAFKNRYLEHVRAARTVEFDEVAWEYERKQLSTGEADRDDPAAIMSTQTFDREIIDALRSLPEEYRATFVLVDMEDLTYDEVAATLGCPIGTVRSRLSRARRLLRTALAHYAEERRYTKRRQSEKRLCSLTQLGWRHEL